MSKQFRPLPGTRRRERCETDHELGYEPMKRTAEIAVHRLEAARRQLLEPAPTPG